MHLDSLKDRVEEMRAALVQQVPDMDTRVLEDVLKFLDKAESVPANEDILAEIASERGFTAAATMASR